MKKTIIFLIAVGVGFLSTADLYPIIDLNDIWPVFPKEKQDLIESAVIDGSIFFMKARAQADLWLAEGETSAKQPLNYSAALEYTQRAVNLLEKSINYYGQAITLGKEAGYVEEVVKKFKSFNYEVFASEKHLNSDIMVLVKAYLSVGNILGAYQQKVDDIGEMLITLNTIKEKLESSQSPDISLSWRLYQQFSQSALFGNYCTMTGAEVLSQ